MEHSSQRMDQIIFSNKQTPRCPKCQSGRVLWKKKREGQALMRRVLGVVYQDSVVGGATGGAMGCFSNEIKANIAAINASQKPKDR